MYIHNILSRNFYAKFVACCQVWGGRKPVQTVAKTGCFDHLVDEDVLFFQTLFCCVLLTLSKLAGRSTDSKPFFQTMSQKSPYQSDPHYLLSGYPPPQHTNFPSEEYKASYDELVDELATPYGRSAQHQTFAIESPSLGSPQHRRGPSLSSQHKQSFSTEYDGKFTEEDMRPQAPRILPVKGEKEADTRTLWQKVRSC